jgi:hypothetical protein
VEAEGDWEAELYRCQLLRGREEKGTDAEAEAD